MPSTSKSQRRLMGYAYSIKKAGKKSKKYKDAPESVKKVADEMSLSQLKDFAETKEDKLPEKVKESIVLKFNEFISQLKENIQK